jgi:hypothetical protein
MLRDGGTEERKATGNRASGLKRAKKARKTGNKKREGYEMVRRARRARKRER